MIELTAPYASVSVNDKIDWKTEEMVDWKTEEMAGKRWTIDRFYSLEQKGRLDAEAVHCLPSLLAQHCRDRNVRLVRRRGDNPAQQRDDYSVNECSSLDKLQLKTLT